jgi:DNA-binding GntR family transcriptional regulator
VPIRSKNEVEPRTLRDQIVEVMQDAILSGQYAPGQRLVEKEFVVRFGVSSIPVREALQELENRGLVARRPNRGCSVVELSLAERKKAFAVRRLLEPDVVAWAAANVTAAHAGTLTAQLAKLKAAADRNDIADFFRQDMILHRLIWDVADNPYATKALDAVLGALFATGLMSSKASKKLGWKKEVEKHARLVEAVVTRKPARAKQTLLEIADKWEGTTTRLLDEE